MAALVILIICCFAEVRINEAGMTQVRESVNDVIKFFEDVKRMCSSAGKLWFRDILNVISQNLLSALPWLTTTFYINFFISELFIPRHSATFQKNEKFSLR